jgi:hypothetical protein
MFLVKEIRQVVVASSILLLPCSLAFRLLSALECAHTTKGRESRCGPCLIQLEERDRITDCSIYSYSTSCIRQLAWTHLAMAPYDLDYRVETLIPNIICGQHGTKLSPEQEETLINVKVYYDPSENRQLCRACGWTDKHELTSSYLPRLRINHTRANAGLWTMGNDWVVWDCPDGERKNDYITHQFLKRQGTTDIPLVKEMVEFKDEDGRYNFLVMSRAKGVPLEHKWHTLSRAAKKSYIQQVAAALRELRQLTAEFPQRVDGSLLGDNVIAQCNSQKQCIKIGKTAEEWLDNMDEELREGISRKLQTRDKTVIEARMQELRV